MDNSYFNYWKNEIMTDLIIFLEQCVSYKIISQEEMDEEIKAFKQICKG